MSTIIGFVGGGGIGYLLIQYINLLQWNQAGTVIWLIAIVVAVMDYASAVLREKVV
jgi:phosphonate transport system permease protein